MSDDERYVLYGSHASYHTAKTRSYLRKKGIPFVERLPASPRFRDYVRPTSGNHRIPQLEAPDGTVVQDSVAILDFLEARFPEPAAYPPGPRQQLATRLFEVLFDGALGRAAWHYRWNFMDENYGFVGREFGRSFRPQGSDDELDHYGDLIRERMEGKRGALGDSPALRPVLEEIYFETLDILERHFTSHPYLFGGLPSTADHMLMGPLFGHLARDPEPSRLMKERAPRVFRWTEHMNTPEVVAPEYEGVPAAWLPDDDLPDTIHELLAMCVRDVMPGLVRSAELYDAWVTERMGEPAGTWIDPKGYDEPSVGRFETLLRGVPVVTGAAVYPLWVWQRGLAWYAAQDEADRRAGRELLEECGGAALLDLSLRRPLRRDGSRIVLG